jgi:microsomal prostaglandin-E synthase 2
MRSFTQSFDVLNSIGRCRYSSHDGIINNKDNASETFTGVQFYSNNQLQQLRSFSSSSSSSSSSASASSTAATRTPVKLYQYKICPFSNIAKAVLTHKKIPFVSIEVNPLTKSELKFSKDYRKVPIVLDGEKQYNGTEEIVPQFTEGGDDFATSSSSKQWQEFSTQKLAPLLYPNLCNTLSNSVRAFDYIHSTNFTTTQKYSIQYVGAVAMYFAASKIQKKYNIDDVRVALLDVLDELESGLDENGATILLNKSSSENPHLGDVTVFGVLKGLEGLPISDDIILHNERYPKIQKWYTNMNQTVYGE